MRKVAGLALAVVLGARSGGTETDVRKAAGDKLDVRATAAPISEVLDRIARETGMKVTYDGAPPRARVSVSLTAVTPAQAVLAVLEGQGLNYALRMDPRSVRIETLLMVAGSGAGAPVPAVRPPGPRQIDREPDITEPEEEAPTEAPAPPPEEQRRPFPFPGGVPPGPSGPALPLALPTAPPAPSASPASPAPQG